MWVLSAYMYDEHTEDKSFSGRFEVVGLFRRYEDATALVERITPNAEWKLEETDGSLDADIDPPVRIIFQGKPELIDWWTLENKPIDISLIQPEYIGLDN